MDQSVVIDGDGHLLELQASGFVDYFEQPYRQRAVDRARALESAPRVATVGDGLGSANRGTLLERDINLRQRLVIGT